MKTNLAIPRMSVLRGARRTVVGALMGMAVLAAVGSPMLASVALAAPPGVDPTPPAATAAGPGAQARYRLLERLYQRELRVLKAEEARLDKAQKVEDRLQERIDALNAKGEDTTPLQNALTSFEAAVAEARTYYDTAKGILDTHAGFGPDGEVVDRAQAGETVRTAGKAERDYHRTMVKAGHELRKALREWVQSHRPRPASATPQSGNSLS